MLQWPPNTAMASEHCSNRGAGAGDQDGRAGGAAVGPAAGVGPDAPRAAGQPRRPGARLALSLFSLFSLYLSSLCIFHSLSPPTWAGGGAVF